MKKLLLVCVITFAVTFVACGSSSGKGLGNASGSITNCEATYLVQNNSGSGIIDFSDNYFSLKYKGAELSHDDKGPLAIIFLEITNKDVKPRALIEFAHISHYQNGVEIVNHGFSNIERTAKAKLDDMNMNSAILPNATATIAYPIRLKDASKPVILMAQYWFINDNDPIFNGTAFNTYIGQQEISF